MPYLRRHQIEGRRSLRRLQRSRQGDRRRPDPAGGYRRSDRRWVVLLGIGFTPDELRETFEWLTWEAIYRAIEVIRGWPESETDGLEEWG